MPNGFFPFLFVQAKKRTLDAKSKDGLLSSVAKNLNWKKGKNKEDTSKGGDFDELISALRTGDVFGEDIAKFKRSRKTKPNSKDSTSPPRNSGGEESRERTVISGRQ